MRHVVFGVNDLVVGGMQQQLVQLLSHLPREGYRYTLVTLFDLPHLVNLYDRVPHDVRVVRLSFGGFGDVQSWWKLHRELRRLNPDLVISSLFFSNTVFRMLSLVHRYRAVAREHNTYVGKTGLQQLVDWVLAKLSPRIVGVSRTVADFTSQQEGIAREKFVVIHNGIDLERIAATRIGRVEARRALASRWPFPDEALVFLNVARLTPQKNHTALVRGFAEYLRSATQPATLLIVGEGGCRPQLQALVSELGLEGSVFLVGMQLDLAQFYCAADCFVSTSAIEGLSNAYLEALAFGLPVLAAPTAGTDELIEESVNGLTIVDASPGGVARALEWLAKADRAALGRGALATAERFGIVGTAEAYSGLINSLLPH